MDTSKYVEIAPGNWQERDDEGEPFGPVHVIFDPDMTLADYLASLDAQPRRTVLKSVIISRLIAAGKIEAAKAALEQDASAYARWWAPDRPAIYHDDPDAIALLTAIGADPDVVLGP